MNQERLPIVWKTWKLRGEFKWNGSSQWKFSVFPFLPKRPKFSVPFVWITSVKRKRKILPVFCKWYNSIPFLFSVPKKYKNHSEISVQMVSAPGYTSIRFNFL